MFLTAPVVASPTDVGMDNVYDIQIMVTDSGGLTDFRDIAVTVREASSGGGSCR